MGTDNMNITATETQRPRPARALQSSRWADLRVIRTLRLRMTAPPASSAGSQGTDILSGVLVTRPHTRWQFHLSVPKTLTSTSFYLRRTAAGSYAFYMGTAQQRTVRYSAGLQQQMLVVMHQVVQAYRQHQRRPARQARYVASWH